MSESQGMVLLVGHCGPDSFALRSALRAALPGMDVEMINSRQDLDAALGGAALLLVNRVLDGRFGSESGVELIRGLASTPGGAPPMMLVSNFPEAQAEAVAAGALQGFGKAELYADTARDRVRSAVGMVEREQA